MKPIRSGWSKTNGMSMQCMLRSLRLRTGRSPVESIQIHGRSTLRVPSARRWCRTPAQDRTSPAMIAARSAGRGRGADASGRGRPDSSRRRRSSASMLLQAARAARVVRRFRRPIGSPGLPYRDTFTFVRSGQDRNVAESGDAGLNGSAGSVVPSTTGTNRSEIGRAPARPACLRSRVLPSTRPDVPRSRAACAGA